MNNISSKSLAHFTRQLSGLVKAGIPGPEAFTMLQRQPYAPAFLKSGEDSVWDASLSELLTKNPRVFGKFYVSIVRAGEKGGNLGAGLDRLSAALEQDAGLQERLGQTLRRTGLLAGLAALVAMLAFTLFIPGLKAFLDANTTAGLKAFLTHLASKAAYQTAVFTTAVMGAELLFRLAYATSAGHRLADAVFLRLPVFGELLRQAAVLRCARSLRTLLDSGVSAAEALGSAADTAGNIIIAGALLSSGEALGRGRPLSASLKDTGVFPEIAVAILEKGEERSVLGAALSAVEDLYGRQVDRYLKGVASMWLPFGITFAGLIIGIAVIRVFMTCPCLPPQAG
ncbi:MAG: type II secretion system F family protein [Elusimicrobiota bacterium]|nr:type II secretion system F family protein [Elusimicrobiota bacterium]